jgi:hypothetical protein
MEYDIFISHTSEDKEGLVRPLATALLRRGWKVWYDEISLKVGDSLRQSIDAGLAKSKYAIVVLSPRFFEKNWPAYELDGLVSKQIGSGHKVIIPLWHNVIRDDVAKFSLPLADKVALVSSEGIETIVQKLLASIGEPRITDHPFPGAGWTKSKCTKCGKMGNNVGYEIINPHDSYDVEWFECPSCGYRTDPIYTEA